ncbi:MAG TPA: nuclear transport factor 2 family protein [Clostridia bacterium]|nr:nuclear transport factor 2 family protein [Clostridia bacterium]
MATVRAIPSQVSDIENRIQSMTQLFVRCYNEGDFETLASQFTNESVVLPPNQRSAPGISAIRELFKWFHDAGANNLKLDVTNIVQGTEMVLVSGTYSITMPLPSGTHFHDRGKYLTNYQRQNNGDYKIIFDCWNSDLPPAPLVP